MRFAPLVILMVGVVVLAAVFATQFASEPRQDVLVGRDGWLFAGWERLADEEPGQVRKAEDLVAAVDQRIAASGGRLVVVLMPNKERIALDHVPDGRQQDFARSGAYDEIVQALVGRGLKVVDTKPLHQRLYAQGHAYQPRDAHWTGYGAEAAAEAIAPAVLSMGPLPGSPGSGETISAWTHVRRYADLVEIQRRHGVTTTPPDDFLIRAYATPPNGPFAVVVVGNSFADRQYGLPQALSHALDRPVQHLISYGAPGAWQAMADFLRADPATRPKRVVWVLGEDCFTDRDAPKVVEALLHRKS
jgi:alginate O-acetyltransferase complex protein AlgJ